jgi:hypothetical protein
MYVLQIIFEVKDGDTTMIQYVYSPIIYKYIHYMDKVCGQLLVEHHICHVYSRPSPPVFDIGSMLTTGPGIHHYAHLASIITRTCTSS